MALLITQNGSELISPVLKGTSKYLLKTSDITRAKTIIGISATMNDFLITFAFDLLISSSRDPSVLSVSIRLFP
jgi:hypothetical protein